MPEHPGQGPGDHVDGPRSRRSSPASRRSARRAGRGGGRRPTARSCPGRPRAVAGRLDHARVVEVALGDQRQRPAEARRRARRPRRRAARAGAAGSRRPGRGRRRAAARRRGTPRTSAARCRRSSAAPRCDPSSSRLTASPHGVWCLSVKYGPKRGEVVARRAEVVVDDVEADGQALAWARVDEALQRRRAAVGVVHGVEVDAVVAPAPAPGERGDRHELDDVDAEVDEVVEPADGGVQGALGRERADVQLVEDRAEGVAPAPGRRRRQACRRGVEDPARRRARRAGCQALRGSGSGEPPSRLKA